MSFSLVFLFTLAPECALILYKLQTAYFCTAEFNFKPIKKYDI